MDSTIEASKWGGGGLCARDPTFKDFPSWSWAAWEGRVGYNSIFTLGWHEDGMAYKRLITKSNTHDLKEEHTQPMVRWCKPNPLTEKYEYLHGIGTGIRDAVDEGRRKPSEWPGCRAFDRDCPTDPRQVSKRFCPTHLRFYTEIATFRIEGETLITSPRQRLSGRNYPHDCSYCRH